MSQTTYRLIRLLSLLQSKSNWTGQELAERLGVTERTIRRDIFRIRELGYRVDSVEGVGGGYRLARGSSLPPLTLDDDEAIALVMSLRMVAMQGEDSIGEAGLRALTKINQIMPKRIQREAKTINEKIQVTSGMRPSLDWRFIQTISQSCRDLRVVEFNYVSSLGEVTKRKVEPYRLLTQGNVWYLLAFDLVKAAWRTFRLDRIKGVKATNKIFNSQIVPSLDEIFADNKWKCEAVVRINVNLDKLTGEIPQSNLIKVIENQAGSCVVKVGAVNWNNLAWYLSGITLKLGSALQVIDSPELQTALKSIANKLNQFAK